MSDPADTALEKWRRALLPLMAVVLVAGGLFFAAASVFELRDLYGQLEQEPLSAEGAVALYDAGRDGPLSAEDRSFRARLALEAEALGRRYHQANATMLARVWTRQLGFITGMMLALVGAAFVLGRLSEAPTKLSAEGQGLKGALETSSPGLVLAVLGSVLMGLSIAIPFSVETRDVNTYLRTAPAGAAGLGAPERLDAGDFRSGEGGGGAQGPSDDPDVVKKEQELFGGD